MLHLSRARWAVLALVLSGSVSAQNPRPADPATCRAFDIRQGVIQDLALRPLRNDCYEVSVRLGTTLRSLRLWPHDVRAPGFTLFADDGVTLKRLPTPKSVTYRGTVLGSSGSVIAATLIAGELEAVIRLDSSSTSFAIQALRTHDPRAAKGRYLIYDAADVTAGAEVCGVTATSTAGAGVDSPGVVTAEIACDADFDLYKKNGRNTTATAADVTKVINAVDVIYQRDVQIKYLVTTIIVRTQATYTTTASSLLLSQFGSRWRNHHKLVKRDVAHLFTGKNLDGSIIGIASLGVICGGGGFGLSQTRFSSNLVRRAGLTAHELGHNWNANHCSGGSCYIMCPGLGGCGRDLTRFNTGSAQAIIRHRNSVSCLTTPGKPVITSLAPASALAFGGQTIVLNGAFLSDVLQVDVGAQSYFPPDLEIVDDQTVRVDLSRIATLGPAAVRAWTLNQVSQALPLLITAASPPVMKAPLLGGGGVPIRYQFAGKPAGDWFLLIAFGTRQVFPFLGSQVLGQGFVLGKGALDGSGFGSAQVTPPVGALIGVTLYSQIVELGAGGTAFSGASAVNPTYIFY